MFRPAFTIPVSSAVASALLARPDTREAARTALLPRLTEFGRYIPSLANPGELGSFDEACSAPDAALIRSALGAHVADIRGGRLAIDRIAERVRACATLKAKSAKEVQLAISESL